MPKLVAAVILFGPSEELPVGSEVTGTEVTGTVLGW